MSPRLQSPKPARLQYTWYSLAGLLTFNRKKPFKNPHARWNGPPRARHAEIPHSFIPSLGASKPLLLLLKESTRGGWLLMGTVQYNAVEGEKTGRGGRALCRSPPSTYRKSLKLCNLFSAAPRQGGQRKGLHVTPRYPGATAAEGRPV